MLADDHLDHGMEMVQVSRPGRGMVNHLLDLDLDLDLRLIAFQVLETQRAIVEE